MNTVLKSPKAVEYYSENHLWYIPLIDRLIIVITCKLVSTKSVIVVYCHNMLISIFTWINLFCALCPDNLKLEESHGWVVIVKAFSHFHPHLTFRTHEYAAE